MVYCAHDSLYSEPILKAFEQESGIKVMPRFDTEATKSLSLVELITRERNQPRCDVFWNNETLGTMDLQRRGLLEPYRGPGFDRIPAAFKDPQGHWTGFAARLRVWIVNTGMHAADQSAIQTTLANPDLSRVTIAKPLYGTTRTHYTVLWRLLGPEKLRQWHDNWRRRGLIEAPSNGRTMGLVASGTCAIGWTDTDDYFVALDRGDPVAMMPVTLDDGRSICIPNTVAIIKGSQNVDAAQRLVNYLLSEKVEVLLSQSKSRQIPLGPVDEARLSTQVRALRPWVQRGVSLTSFDNAPQDCLDWLKSEYAH